MENEDKRGPGLRFPPPLLLVAALAAGYGAGYWYPLPLPGAPFLVWLGIALCLLAGIIAAVAIWQFRRADTHVEPWQPASALIERGLYRYSRNPIYLTFVLIALGLGLALDNGWILLAIVPMVWALTRLVIRKEERYLEAKFGSAYLGYKQRVRRWL